MTKDSTNRVGGYSPLDDTMNYDQAVEIWTEMVAMYPQMAKGTKEEVAARQGVWGRLLSQANYQITKDMLEQHYLTNEFAPKPTEVIKIKQKIDPSMTTVKEDMKAVYGDKWKEIYEKERAHYKELEQKGIERLKQALKGGNDDE